MSEHKYTILYNKNTKDITGHIFGRLRVISFAGYRPHYNGKQTAWWLCQCTCGITKAFRATNLIQGGTQSCGCVKAENARKQNTTHGGRHTVEYTIWCAMIQRCSYHKNDSFK